VSTFMEHAIFLRTWLTQPKSVGAIAPSSTSLAKLITKEITASGGMVIELGPGTGAFTRQILATGLPAEHLVLIEKQAAFAQLLRQQFPTTQVRENDVAGMRPQFCEWSVLQAQAVVSGLPLLTMGRRVQMRVLSTCFAALRPGGAVYQFTYHLRCPIERAVLHRLGLVAHPMGRAWANLPPAAVYRIARLR
jgi:phosphatidylethanolamine/phosphatidyl-N-methylethanolamine N-methyltransferase